MEASLLDMASVQAGKSQRKRRRGQAEGVKGVSRERWNLLLFARGTATKHASDSSAALGWLSQESSGRGGGGRPAVGITRKARTLGRGCRVADLYKLRGTTAGVPSVSSLCRLR